MIELMSTALRWMLLKHLIGCKLFRKVVETKLPLIVIRFLLTRYTSQKTDSMLSGMSFIHGAFVRALQSNSAVCSVHYSIILCL